MEEKIITKVRKSFSFTFNFHPGDDFEASEEIIMQQAAAGNVVLPDSLKDKVERPGNEILREEKEPKKEEKESKTAKKS